MTIVSANVVSNRTRNTHHFTCPLVFYLLTDVHMLLQLPPWPT